MKIMKNIKTFNTFKVNEEFNFFKKDHLKEIDKEFNKIVKKREEEGTLYSYPVILDYRYHQDKLNNIIEETDLLGRRKYFGTEFQPKKNVNKYDNKLKLKVQKLRDEVKEIKKELEIKGYTVILDKADELTLTVSRPEFE
jgi:hypothetical protein